MVGSSKDQSDPKQTSRRRNHATSAESGSRDTWEPTDCSPGEQFLRESGLLLVRRERGTFAMDCAGRALGAERAWIPSEYCTCLGFVDVVWIHGYGIHGFRMNLLRTVR